MEVQDYEFDLKKFLAQVANDPQMTEHLLEQLTSDDDAEIRAYIRYLTESRDGGSTMVLKNLTEKEASFLLNSMIGFCMNAAIEKHPEHQEDIIKFFLSHRAITSAMITAAFVCAVAVTIREEWH